MEVWLGDVEADLLLLLPQGPLVEIQQADAVLGGLPVESFGAPLGQELAEAIEKLEIRVTSRKM
jgi:hypothetical protein